jgi:mannose-6-phosphate isomerase-like protein (cupin superfamily)
MEMFTFDRKEWRIPSFDSAHAFATIIARGELSAKMQVTCLTVEPGGVIGTHPAVGGQLFLVVTGSGWVSGDDGERVAIRAGQGVRWDAGEIHTSGSDVGFTAIAVEGPTLRVYEPEA